MKGRTSSRLISRGLQVALYSLTTSSMNSSVICHPEVVSRLDALAGEGDIPVQRDILRAGGTDAGAIHITRTGVKTGGISVPCRYIHTPVEMADLTDAEHCVRLAAAFAQCRLDG